jgi:hypothetical protein
MLSGDAVARRHAAEVEGFLDVFSVARPTRQARGLLRRIRQQPTHLIGVQPGERTGCRRRAKRTAIAMRRMAGRTEALDAPRF